MCFEAIKMEGFMMRNIKIVNNIVYDFLCSLYRLRNNEALFSEVKLKVEDGQQFNLNNEINEWSSTTYKEFPEDMIAALNTYFDMDTHFGMCLTSFIAESKSDDVPSFLNYLSEKSPEDFLTLFIDTGYGPQNGEVSKELVERLIRNRLKAIDYINDNISIPENKKWSFYQFFLDPNKMKQDLMELLKWYYSNIYYLIEKSVFEVQEVTTRELSVNLNRYGPEYLNLITGVSQKDLSGFRSVIIVLSFHYELGRFQTSTMNNDMIYLLGYRYLEMFVNNKHGLLSSIQLFKVLADETRLNIIRLLSKGSLYGREIAAKLSLSNSNVSYHTSMLVYSGLISSEKKDNKTYFTLDNDEFESIIALNVKKLLD